MSHGRCRKGGERMPDGHGHLDPHALYRLVRRRATASVADAGRPSRGRHVVLTLANYAACFISLLPRRNLLRTVS